MDAETKIKNVNRKRQTRRSSWTHKPKPHGRGKGWKQKYKNQGQIQLQMARPIRNGEIKKIERGTKERKIKDEEKKKQTAEHRIIKRWSRRRTHI